jgi:hypothetical protein
MHAYVLIWHNGPILIENHTCNLRVNAVMVHVQPIWVANMDVTRSHLLCVIRALNPLYASLRQALSQPHQSADQRWHCKLVQHTHRCDRYLATLVLACSANWHIGLGKLTLENIFELC